MSPIDLRPLLAPASIAVVGVTRRDHSPSRIIVENLKQYPFPGRVYLVNPSGESIEGLPTFPDIASLPEPVDLAMVMVPAAQATTAVRASIERGVRAAVVCSAGWADDPRPEGAARQAELASVIAGRDILLCGPNSEGFLNLPARVPVCFSSSISLAAIDRCLPYEGLAPGELADRATGNVAIVAQSGGIGFSLFNRGLARGVRFSTVISTGNEVGLEMQDFVDHLIDDPATDVILLYIEGLNDLGRFPHLAARAAARGTRLVVAKVGRSAAAARAALSHTGHLAGDDAAFDAVFRRWGVVRAEDPEEMLDIALALSQSAPIERFPPRAAIVSYSGGSAVWMADACARVGVELPPLGDELQARLREVLPPFAATQNPVDISGASALKPAQVAAMVLPDPGIDAVVLITTLRNVAIFDEERPALEQMRRDIGKALVVYSYTEPSIESRRALAELALPAFTSIDRCAAALAALARRPRVDSASAQSPIAMSEAPILCEYETYALLAAVNIEARDHRLVTSAAEAITAAATVGYPVALKVQAPSIAHKARVGGVALGLASPAAVEHAFAEMARRFDGAHGDVHGYLVQSMAPTGVEVIVGVHNTSGLGPMVVLGWGGALVEVIDRRVVYPAPFSESTANDLIEELGIDRVVREIDPLAALVAAVSQLAAAAPSLAELDLNPVIVEPSGAVHVVDALAIRHIEGGLSHDR